MVPVTWRGVPATSSTVCVRRAHAGEAQARHASQVFSRVCAGHALDRRRHRRCWLTARAWQRALGVLVRTVVARRGQM